MLKDKDVLVPLDVPKDARKDYIRNFLAITCSSGRLMLFAGDQKVEHLNDDFYGNDIHKDDNEPEHFFRIANKSRIGVFAGQLGLIARYGMDYRGVNYLIKLNSKTNIVPTSQQEAISTKWFSIDDVMAFKKSSGLNILGIGYTIYLGSENENAMLTEAAQIVHQAHQNGLITVLWIYPRGKAVKDEKDPHLIAGATGVAACLGTDFVKVNYPKKEGVPRAESFKEAVAAAGRTHVICAGGSSTDAKKFLQELHEQIFISGAAGNATGRNIHQRPLDEAVRMCNAVYAITVDGKTVDEAMAIYNGR